MTNRCIAQPFYTDPPFYRDPNYEGAASVWSEEEALGVFRELLLYFGGCELPAPPQGLPGRNGRVDPVAFETLQLGKEYYHAVIMGQPGRKWTLHQEMVNHLRSQYEAGEDAERRKMRALAERRALDALNTPPAPHPDSVVYFIGSDDGPIKIGIARDPAKRLRSLQTGHHDKLAILCVTVGGREAEAAYHQRFAADRLHGEWFERSPEILAEIAALQSPDTAVLAGVA